MNVTTNLKGDFMAIAKEKRYILADLKTNQNKWWQVELYDDGRVISRWGRVGDEGCEKYLGDGEALFQTKCREKERKGYVEQRTLSSIGTSQSQALPPNNLERVATEQIAANSPEAVALIKKLVKANVHSILASTTLEYNSASGLFSTPLGIVTQDGITQARRALVTIADAVARGSYGDSSLVQAINQYLNLVPQNIGRRRKSIQELYPDLNAVQQQNDLLDRLETSLQMALTPDANSGQADNPKVFESSLHLVQSRTEFRRLREKYQSTLNQKHAAAHLQLKRAYTVEISSRQKAFAAKTSSINNVMELWHGTNTANILSILKDGFRISPPSTATITGKMFGNGIYVAPSATNQCCGFCSQSEKSTSLSVGTT